MEFIITAAVLSAALLILSYARPAQPLQRLMARLSRAPAVTMLTGAGLAAGYRLFADPLATSEWIAAGADVLLAALAFAAATQFRVSELAKVCPASFRLTLGGAPLFLLICGIAAFSFAPGLSLPAAFLVAGAMTLNGAAFDRRAVADAPTPAVIKAAVRLESAAILALGLPVAVLLEGIATAAPAGLPAATPLFETAKSLFLGFAIGGSSGLAMASYDNKLKYNKKRAAAPIIAACFATLVAALLGASPVIAAAAAGLLWGEQTNAPIPTRVRIRSVVDRTFGPIGFFAFGVVLGPRIFQADMLTLILSLIHISEPTRPY